MACGLVHVSYSLPKWQAVKWQFIIETSTELLDVARFWNTSDELSFKCFKNSFLHDRVFITHMRSPVVLCCYCFISFLTSCVPNETKYPSLSYFSNSLFNALGNETATSKTNIMKITTPLLCFTTTQKNKEKCSHNNKLLDYVRKKYDIIC